MDLSCFYRYAIGREVLKTFQNIRGPRICSWFLHTKWSRWMIPSYIKRNHIDMSEFQGQTYDSFAEFFGRRKEFVLEEQGSNVLISPCDSLLSIYPVKKGLVLPLKGSQYRISDLVPEPVYPEMFAGGACFVFRLEASDYHHFCYVDNGIQDRTRYIPGELHSVQPIALEKLPVFYLNRRWWTPLETEHFGMLLQIEIGALMVGGVTHVQGKGAFLKGEEMGNFELAGSTIVLLIGKEAMSKIRLDAKFRSAWMGREEVRVHMGERLGEKQEYA